ncbi:21063_t:CDS:2 [Gigaspora margarita]|uniref:21063_t:CDS:1 n=1 Tax=Gigaspora margarita TaxID=4874 RepID=A0ABN7VMM7_GIGMA|nr:21063_t:CDS:2 [Gigaspora margarita]
MPGHDKKRRETLENLLETKKIVYCSVDSGNKKNSIETKYLTKDQTLKKLGESLCSIEVIEFPESQNLIEFIKKKTCHHIKMKVMQLQRKQSSDALAHIEKEISTLSSIESSEARNRAMLKRDELRKSEFYAELLISEHTIELFDGDTGTISEALFSGICKHVHKSYPNLQIFVFAVSVGCCTRGLFMRLLFLEKDLSNQLNVDAFVLIDTEGLGAPEKMNEPESEKKDLILATFAMGISNLTILNVLGESMRDLTEILQIAIVTMARLEKADMASDILMANLSELEEKFREALREALRIADEQDTVMGISSIKCLQILDERIKKGQLLKQFRPFKNGATAHAPPSGQYREDVVDLYNSILEDCKNSQGKIEFVKWINETIDDAFFQHEKQITKKFPSELREWSHDPKKNSVLKNKCSELITKGLKDVPKKERENLEKYLKENKKDEKREIKIKKIIKDYIKQNYDSTFIKLTRIFEASFIRKGLSSEFLEIINRGMKDIINKMQGVPLSETGRKQIVEEIWMDLRKYISSKDKVRPVVEQIDEVNDEFSTVEYLINRYKKEALPDLNNCKAYKSHKYIVGKECCLDEKDANMLVKKLDNLADIVLKKRNSQHFYPGIVRDLKREIDSVLVKMGRYQEKWNRENNPLSILDQKKGEYTKIIDTRLQHGFSLVSEAILLGITY